jgi:uncharacterized protein YkwD
MFTRVRILLAIAALATVAGPAAASPGRTVGPLHAQAGGASSLASEVVAELNTLRRQRGLAPLRLSPALSAAAAAHSREMAANGYFDHDSADGSPFWKRVERFYPVANARLWALGENLLWSSPGVDAPGAIQMWLESPEHKKNMLDPRWREIGLSALHFAAAPGVYKGLEVTLVTADVGLRR